MTTITETSTTTNRFFVLYTDKARLTLCVLAKNGLREAAIWIRWLRFTVLGLFVLDSLRCS